MAGDCGWKFRFELWISLGFICFKWVSFILYLGWTVFKWWGFISLSHSWNILCSCWFSDLSNGIFTYHSTQFITLLYTAGFSMFFFCENKEWIWYLVLQLGLLRFSFHQFWMFMKTQVYSLRTTDSYKFSSVEFCIFSVIFNERGVEIFKWRNLINSIKLPDLLEV